MASNPHEDVLTYLSDLGLVVRGVTGFTEADLLGWEMRPETVTVGGRTVPAEPSVTADVDTHGLTVTVVRGGGESGYTEGSDLSDAVYRALRLVLDVTINGTFYPCIRAVTPPYVSAYADDGRTAWHIDLEILRYIGS